MAVYGHGGDIYSLTQPVLDFSANLNPFGMPESVRQGAIAGVLSGDKYPDPHCTALVQALAQRDGVAESQILCGNGAADLIFRLALAVRPKKALVTAPTFSEYQQAVEVVGCQVTHHLLLPENQYDLTETIGQDITAELDMVFLCTPNNPTGRVIPRPLLEQVLHRCEETDTLLVLDECFLQLTDTDPKGMADLVADHPQLFLLRAFTKCYAMAGLRLGYCLSGNQALLDKMSQSAQPWSVSSPAQGAGLAAVQLTHWPKQARDMLAEERPFLQKALQDLGLEVTEGKANYLLFRADGHPDLKEKLVEQGILIRSCGNYVGLTQEHYRVCVRCRADNLQLLSALKEVI